MSRLISSYARKSLAALLSVLFILGTFVVSTPIAVTAKDSTADEANVVEVGKLTANSGAKSYVKKTSSNTEQYYFAQAGLTEISVTFEPDGIVIPQGEEGSLFARLYKTSESAQEINSGVDYTINSNGKITAKFNLDQIYSSGIETGEYQMDIVYIADTVFTKKFKVVGLPNVKNLTYKNSSDEKWIDKNDTVSFAVDSEVVKKVEYKHISATDKTDITDSLSSGKYSFTAETAGTYKITVADELGQTADKDTAELKIDKDVPVQYGDVSITKSGENYKAKWTNSNLVVAVSLQDDKSGIDSDKITVKDTDNNSVTPTITTAVNNIYNVAFDAEKQVGYTVEFYDKAGNHNTVTVSKDDILIDKTKPAAGDFTVTFSEYESQTDAALRLVTFGMYDKRKVKAEVKVKDNGMSPIDEVKLYDGETEVTAKTQDGKAFLLPTKDEDTNAASKYNLFVKASDKAGNVSDKFDILQTAVEVKVIDSEAIESILDENRKKSFEIILNNKVKPTIGSISIDGAVDDHITKGKTGSVTVSDNVSGLKRSYVMYAKKNETGSIITGTDTYYSTTSKAESSTVSFTIPNVSESGWYTFTIAAENNCGLENTLTKDFYIDVDAPQFTTNAFSYSNSNNDSWTNDDVTVSISISDESGIEKAEVKHNDTTTTVEPQGNKITFTADEYGEYTLTVTDKLGNKASKTTENIKIDKEAPEATEFTYENDINTKWSNKKSKVSFKVIDKPAGAASGVKSVSITGVDDAGLSYDDTTKEYSFTADRYGKYEVVVTDNAGNTGTTDSAVIKYDNSTPIVKKVEFSEVKNPKSYGTYSKNAITMTVEVEDTDTNNNNSGFSNTAVVVKDSVTGDALTVNRVESNNTKHIYIIENADAVKNFTFQVTDIAGNTSDEYELDSGAVIVKVGSRISAEAYEVLSTLATADVADAEFKDFISSSTNSNVYWKNDEAKGSIATKVTDELVGIHNIEVKFGKMGARDALSDYQTNYDGKTSGFKDVTSSAVEDYDSAAAKVKSVNINYNTSDFNSGKLESGRYALAIKAENNAGNTVIRAFELDIDNSAPEITSVSITGDDIKSSSENGVYSGGKVKIKIKVDDRNNNSIPSGGIDSVTLSAGKDADGQDRVFTTSAESGATSGELEFELPLSDTAYNDLKFTTVDNFGHNKEFKISDFTITVNSKSITPDASDFEIVANTDSGNIKNITDGDTKFEGIQYNFDKNYTDEGNFYVRNDGTLVGTFEDKLSGIYTKDFKLIVKKSGSNSATEIPYNSEVLSVVESRTGAKVTSINVTFDTAKFATKYQNSSTGIKDGTYSAEFSVTNSSGASKSFTTNFNIDKTAPSVTKIKFTPVDNPNGVDKFFNLISFGLFANQGVKAELTIEDAAPSSGIKAENITLTSSDDQTVSYDDEFTKNGNVYTKSYTLSASQDSTDKNNYKDLIVSVSDNLSNGTINKHYYNSSTVADSGDGEANMNADENFDVILNNNNSTIEHVVNDNDNKDKQKDGFFFEGFDIQMPGTGYYVKRTTENNSTISAEFMDTLSGISNVEAYLITNGGERAKVNLSLNKEIRNSAGKQVKKITDITASYNTKSLSSGQFELIFAITNNIGLKKEFTTGTFYIDETAPKIDKIKFIPGEEEDSALEGFFNLITFGLFSQKAIRVELTVSEEAPAVGIANSGIKITSKDVSDGIEADDSSFKAEGNTYTKVFRLVKNDSNYKDIKIYVSDLLGNSINPKYYIDPDKVSFDKGQETVYEDFDIVVNKDNSTIVKNDNYGENSRSGFVYKGFYFANDKSAIYKNDSKTATISAEFTDKVAGIQKVTATLLRPGESEAVDVTNYISVLSKDDEKVNLSSARTATVHAVFNATKYDDPSGAKRLKSGQYTLTFAVMNNTNLVKRFATVFNIDKTAPEVYSVQFTQDDNAVDNFLNFLSFGLYSNNNIKVTAIVRDADPSSGMKDSMIYATDKNSAKAIDEVAGSFREVDQSELTGLTDADKKFKYYEKCFIIKNNSNRNYLDFKFKLQDNADNKRDNVKYYNGKKVIIGEDVYTYPYDGSTLDKMFAKFNIISADSDKFRPTITKHSLSKSEGTVQYNEKNKDGSVKKRWYSGDVKFKFTAQDKSGNLNLTLQKFVVKLNGKDVTKYCTVNSVLEDDENMLINNTNNVYSSGAIAKDDIYREFDDTYKQTEIEVTINTSDIKDKSLKPVFGKNYFTASVKTNTKAVYPKESKEVFKEVFYLDNQKPVIKKFEFAGDGNIDSSGNPQETDDMTVEETDFGFYFKKKTAVTVTASDKKGCGVKTIRFVTVSEDTNKKTVYKQPAKIVNNKATFTVPADFRGRIYAYAVDLVSNRSIDYSPDDTIVESNTKSSNSNKVTVKPEDSSVKDAKGHNLYSRAATVTLTAEAKYAGIRSVRYSISTGGGQTVTIPNKARQLKSTKGWTVQSKHRNLVTKMTRTITVDANRNDIVVKLDVTDRAGYTVSNSKTISIDKTKPSIKVSYTPAGANNTIEGIKYFNKTRTANITVTERNFDPKKFVSTISRKFKGENVSVIPGTNWNNPVMNENNQDGTTHTARLVFSKDGEYTFNLKVKDKVDNVGSDYNEKNFVIDKTAPKITVTYDINHHNGDGAIRDGYYNQTRTATIKIDDDNFYKDKVKITTNRSGSVSVSETPNHSGLGTPADRHKNPNSGTIAFDKDGYYSFTVNFEDKAGNKAQEVRKEVFAIDKTPGKISFPGMNKRVYGDTVSPKILFDDKNVGSGSNNSFTVMRTYWDKTDKKLKQENVRNSLNFGESSTSGSVTFAAPNIPVTINRDGVYKITANMTDKAGNTTSNVIKVFSVNRFGSTFTYGNDSTKNLIESGITNKEKDVVIDEYNVNKLKEQHVKISCDGTSKALKQGSGYTVSQSGSENDGYKYTYTIKASNFTGEGNYVATIASVDYFNKYISNRTAYKSKDSAKKKVDNTCPVSFTVDKSKPMISISGISSNEYYKEASKKVKITCSDANLVAKNLKVLYDGKEMKLGKDDITVEAGSVEVNLELDADGNDVDRNLKVMISDRAGNSTTKEIKDFRLNATWIARLLHYNLPLVIGAGVLLAAIIAGLCILASKKRKKEADGK